MQSIAHYRIVSKLGEGGMGAVYRATDTKLGRDVAIKVIPDSFACDPDRLARFTREAQVLASLNHPNVAAIYGVEERAIVMELVEGKTLAGPLSAEDALPLIHQLIDALEYAHEKGIIHRDLKPPNIIVTPEGRLKVLDFGLAKAIETVQPVIADSPTRTIAVSLPGIIMGTAGFMSPKQARGGKVDHRGDIWAFGAVVFEILTGKPAFPGDTISDILASILRTDPDFAAVPLRCRSLVRHCLTRDVKHRLGWIGDARMFLDELPAAEPSSGTQTRPRYLLSAALILLAAAAGFAISRLLPSSAGSVRLPAAKIVRVTTGSASFNATVSPDGKLVAYHARRPGRQTLDIWVQQVGRGAAIRLTDDPALTLAGPPVFSADASRVFYYSDRDPPGIYEIPVLGGEPHLLIAGAHIGWVQPSPDAKWLLYTLNGKILVRPQEGGEPRTLSARGAFQAIWAPDSRRILAFIYVPGQPGFKLITIALDTAEVTPASDFSANLLRRGFTYVNVARAIAWLPGDDLVFSAGYGDAINLWRIPIPHAGDAQPSAVTLGPWSNGNAQIRGNHLVFTNARLSAQIWRLPGDLNRGTVLGELTRVTEDLVEAQFPEIRPDDSMLAFISRKEGGQGLFIMDMKTRKERRLYMARQMSAYATFSPDGSQVAFGGGGGIWATYVIQSSGGDAKLVGNAAGRIRGWSRDGRFLLVWRMSSGKGSIGVLDLSTSHNSETMHADRGLGAPRLSPDNRWVAFQTEQTPQPQIWIAPFRGSDTVPESQWIHIGSGVLPFWSPDSHTIYFVRTPEGASDPSQIMRQPLDVQSANPAGPATEFYRTNNSIATDITNTITVSRDAVYTLLRGGMSEIWMMDLP